jgi:hypothetical protein
MDGSRRPLPQPLGHALAQLRRRRFLLVPAEPGAAAEGRRRYPVSLSRSLLTRLPGSPAFREVLATTAAGPAAFAGQAWLGPDDRPRLALDGLGVWRLTLPGRSGTYGVLRELRTPEDLRPVSSRVAEVARGMLERRHRIPLRYHPGAWLIIAVAARPHGGPRYDAWIWHGARHRASALWWDEARRVIDLFRDLAASWFWIGAPPRPADGTRADGARDEEAPPASTGAAAHA